MKENILIIQTAFLGDCVLTLPMIGKLKEKYPDSSISVLCIPSTKELFEHSTYIDKIIVYDKKGEQKSLMSFIRMMIFIRKCNFNKIYSPHRSLRSSLLAFFSNAVSTTGFDISAFSFIYGSRVKYNKNKHEVARNLDLAGFDTSLDKWKIFPQLNIPEETFSKAEKIVEDFGGLPVAVLAPGSVWNTKMYPAEYFKEIINYLISRNFCIVLLGGKNDEQLCSNLSAKYSTNVKSFAGMLSVVESVALLKKASLLISNDSAPTHLGMAAGVPTITVYCSTIPDFGFYPYSEKSRIVSLDGLKCKPCGIHGHVECPIKTFECGLNLSPDRVITAINELIPSKEK